jgi:hypothetical protein
LGEGRWTAGEVEVAEDAADGGGVGDEGEHLPGGVAEVASEYVDGEGATEQLSPGETVAGGRAMTKTSCSGVVSRSAERWNVIEGV